MLKVHPYPIYCGRYFSISNSLITFYKLTLLEYFCSELDDDTIFNSIGNTIDMHFDLGVQANQFYFLFVISLF